MILKSNKPLINLFDNRNLLIFDLDETLFFASGIKLEIINDFEIFDYFIYYRPGLINFIENISKYYRLAVWTSSSLDYATGICNEIFKNFNLEFIWARDKCTRQYDSELQEAYYIKNLQKLKKYGYKLNNLIIVDDTPQKHIKNHGNLIKIKSFEGDQLDNELAFLYNYLLSIASCDNYRSLEKRSWRI